MRLNFSVSGILATLMALLLTACAAPYQPPPAASTQLPDAYGRIESVDVIRTGGGSSGAGAIIGGIVGGVIGHQLGQGRGKDVATVAGAVGGAIVGNEIERGQAQGRDLMRLGVRMEDGSYRTVTIEPTDLRVGDRILVSGGRVERR